MKFFSMFKTAGLAVVFLLATQVAQAGAAGPVTVPFGAGVLAGPYAGTMGDGWFEYDPSFVGPGPVTLGPLFGPNPEGLLAFEFTILGQPFHMGDDVEFPTFPTVDFLDGLPVAADFRVENPGGLPDVQALGVFGDFSSGPTSLPGGAIVAVDGYDFYIEAFIVPVPVPPALWLFGSGLLGLLGMARRKKAA